MSGFVHLHTHSEFSSLDGLTTIPEAVEQAVLDGQPGLAITDHGICSGHPYLQKAADEAGIKAIFGLEAYFCDDRLLRPDGDKELSKSLQKNYNHLTIIAKSQAGLQNLWAASTESWRDGAYPKHRPRMDWDTLRKFSEGTVVLTGCLRGPLAVNITEDREDVARANLMRLLDIYGDDLYLEIMPNDMPDQVKVNKALVAMGQEFGVPLVATVDSHYPTKDHTHTHKTWIACQTNKDIQDETDLFGDDLGLYLKTEEEVRRDLSYLGGSVADEAVKNTVLIADQCDARINQKAVKLHYSKSRNIKDDDKKLFDICLDNWHKTIGTGVSQEEYIARFEREFALLKSKGFTPYFLMVADYCNWARQNGILVGPGRGSGAASIVAYLCGITAVDPVKNKLLFERFMTEGRQDLPDFDVDFPASKREDIQNYIRSQYGDDYVVRVGTHLRYKNKGVFQKLFSVMSSTMDDPGQAFLDARAISKIIEDAEADTAGLGLKYAELWAKVGDDLQPYADKYPEIFSLAEQLVGRLNSYGRHAAGLAISTEEPVTGTLPLRAGEDGQSMITQFEFKDLEQLGLVKFDILTISTLDKLQATFDSYLKTSGNRVDPYKWKQEMNDPQVWEFLCQGNTLGVFQVETFSGTKMVKRMKPKNIEDLSALVALVRPGPMNSGLTDMYLRRRDGIEPVTYPHPKLEKITKDTFGALVYQEQVMQTCIDLAGFTSDEAEKVRKVLGKKLTDQIAAQGDKFIRQAKERGISESITRPLWNQITEFAKYGFNKSHSYSYAVLAYWTLYSKMRYMEEFFAGAMSTADKDRIPEFVRDAQRLGIKILPQDVNLSKKDFETDGNEVRYGLGSIKGIGGVAVDNIIAGQPYSSFEDFQERSGVAKNVTMLLARVGAFDSLPGVGNRRALVKRLEAAEVKGSKDCYFHTLEVVNKYNDLPCTFDWDSEEPPINQRTGKKMRPKPVPKRCTVRCRNYTPPPPIQDEDVEPYSKEEIREIEKELLGLHLSSTVFDDLDEEHRNRFREQAMALLADGPHGVYTIIGNVSGLQVKNDRNGNPYGRWTIETEVGDFNVIAFNRVWAGNKEAITDGAFVLLDVESKERGLQLKNAAKIH